jgi:pterin-4a-carbinolamine dehydratase
MRIREIIVFILGIVLGVILASKCNKSKIEVKEVLRVDTLKVVVKETLKIKVIDTIYLTAQSQFKAYKCDSVIYFSNLDFSKLNKLEVKRNLIWDIRYNSVFNFKKFNNNWGIYGFVAYDFEKKSFYPLISLRYKNINLLFKPYSVGFGLSLNF